MSSLASGAPALSLFVRFTGDHGVEELDQLTPVVIDAFLASRPRTRPRSFNQLVGIIGCFLDWTVSQQLIDGSPLRARRRRETARYIPFLFDTVQARRLLDAAAALPDNPWAPGRGTTYHAIFALCYGLGLRAGEACGLRVSDVDADRQLIVVRGGKFGKSRLIPHGQRMGELLARQVERRNGGSPDGPLFSFDGRRSVHPGTASHTFRHLVADLELPVLDVCRRPGCIVFGIRSLSGACCAGIEKHSTRRSASISYRRSWVMSIRPRPLSI